MQVDRETYLQNLLTSRSRSHRNSSLANHNPSLAHFFHDPSKPLKLFEMAPVPLSWEPVPAFGGSAKAYQLMPDPKEIKRRADKDARDLATSMLRLSLARGNLLNPEGKFEKFEKLPTEIQIKIISEALRGSFLRVVEDGKVLGDKMTPKLTNKRIRILSKVSKSMREQVNKKTTIYSGCTFQFRTPTGFYNFLAQLPRREKNLIRSVEFYIYHTFHISDYRPKDKEEINLQHRKAWIQVAKDMPRSVEHIILNLHQGRDVRGDYLGMRHKNPQYISTFVKLTRGPGVDFEYRGVGNLAEDKDAVEKWLCFMKQRK